MNKKKRIVGFLPKKINILKTVYRFSKDFTIFAYSLGVSTEVHSHTLIQFLTQFAQVKNKKGRKLARLCWEQL